MKRWSYKLRPFNSTIRTVSPSRRKINEEKSTKEDAEKYRHILSWEIFEASSSSVCIAKVIMIDLKMRGWLPEAKQVEKQFTCPMPESHFCAASITYALLLTVSSENPRDGLVLPTTQSSSEFILKWNPDKTRGSDFSYKIRIMYHTMCHINGNRDILYQ